MRKKRRRRRGKFIRRATVIAKRGRRAKRREKAQAAFRRACLALYGARCQRCGSTGYLEAHHVRPLSRGGADCAKTNGAVLCGEVNGMGGCHHLVHSRAVSDWRAWLR